MDEDMKRELLALKEQVSEVRIVNRRIIATLVRLEGKVDDLSDRMLTKEEFHSFKDSVNRRFDGFAALFEEFRFRWSVHADTLTWHDKRLTRLEARRS